jgi:hypothetical protein
MHPSGLCVAGLRQARNAYADNPGNSPFAPAASIPIAMNNKGRRAWDVEFVKT